MTFHTPLQPATPCKNRTECLSREQRPPLNQREGGEGGEERERERERVSFLAYSRKRLPCEMSPTRSSFLHLSKVHMRRIGWLWRYTFGSDKGCRCCSFMIPRCEDFLHRYFATIAMAFLVLLAVYTLCGGFERIAFSFCLFPRYPSSIAIYDKEDIFCIVGLL